MGRIDFEKRFTVLL